MPKNEEGEFELVLGNRQLLSIFFVVVILMGVCLGVGYLIGKGSAEAAAHQTARAKRPEPGPAQQIIVEPPTGAEVSLAAKSAAKPAPAPVKAEIPGAAPLKVEPKAPEAKKPEPPPAAEPAGEPQPGQTFLQVAAVKRLDGELLVEVLQKKGFHARIANGPTPGIFRVLVGPLADAAAITQTKANLESQGFRSILRKY